MPCLPRLASCAMLWLSVACTASGERASSEDAAGDDEAEVEPRTSDASARDASAQSAKVDAGRTSRDGAAPNAGESGKSDAGTARGADEAGTTANAPAPAESASAVAELERYLAQPTPREPLEQQPFVAVPLTRGDAARAKTLLWDDFARSVRESRKGEVGASESVVRTIPGDGRLSLRYYLARRGSAPAQGRSLFISMHGGGNAGAATNDSQWKNQLALVDSYQPKDAVWVAPRAPIDDWNMWFVEGLDVLFERLITDMIVFEGIDPNKVYLTGYSAGGDGVYQLGPRMAERWAGAAMSAGHPNSASPLNLRNVAFAIHVGGADTAFDRNKKGEEWGKQLEALAAHMGGYLNQWKVHAGLPHWMNLEDAVSIPFLQNHTRDPYPSKVVWRQAELTRPHLYWLAVDAKNQKFASEVRASYSGQDITLSGVKALASLTIRLADEMLDLDLPVRIVQDSRTVFTGKVDRTIRVLARTLGERSDPAMLFSGEVTVSLE